MTVRRTNLSRRQPAEFGTIRERNGRFSAFFRRDGQTVRAPHVFTDRPSARAWLAGQERAIRGGAFVAPIAGLDTLEAFARNWLANRTDIAPKTRQNYENVLAKWILPRLGTRKLAAITPDIIQTWRATALRDAARDAAGEVAKRGAHPARQWAAARGIDVPATGRLPHAVLRAWEDAGAPLPTKRRRQGDGSRAIAESYRCLHAIFAAAERDDLILKNPCRIRGAGAVRAEERTPPTPAEVERLAAAMPNRLAALVTVAAWSGLRSGELRALRRADVTFTATGATLRVEHGVQELTGQPITLGRLKTRASRRVVAVPSFVAQVLREHMDAHTGPGLDALLFTTKDGRVVSRSNLGDIFRRASATAGLGQARFHFHDLRHAAASAAFLAGASVVAVQARLGHATPAMSLHYGHTTREADHDLAERLAVAFGPREVVAS